MPSVTILLPKYSLKILFTPLVFGHIFAPLSLNNVTNDSLNLYVSYTDFGPDSRLRAGVSTRHEVVLNWQKKNFGKQVYFRAIRHISNSPRISNINPLELFVVYCATIAV